MTYITAAPIAVEAIAINDRNMNLLSQNLYSVDMNFNGISLQKSIISWDNFNLDEESKQNLVGSKAKISALPLFSRLEEYGSELQKIRNEIHKYTVFSEGQRVAITSRIGLKNSLKPKHLKTQA